MKNAKEHLSEDGFIIIDHKPYLYASKSTNWIDARNSLVADWLSDSSVLENYQWKKSIEANTDSNIDVLQWRYHDSEEVQFEVKFTTYRYDIEQLIEHLSQLDLSHERILTEWGVNGLSNEGTRFIGLVSHPGKKYSPKREFIDKVIKRNERLWSDHDLYQKQKNLKKI